MDPNSRNQHARLPVASSPTSSSTEFPCHIGCSFDYYIRMFRAGPSGNELIQHIDDLLKAIVHKFYERVLTECIIVAVRECIEACKISGLSIGSVFYQTRFQGNSLPACLILTAKSDVYEEDRFRYCLLQIILDEAPLDRAIREELYLACAKKTYNGFFSRIRLAEGYQSFSVIEDNEWKLTNKGAKLTVNSMDKGFTLKWFIPSLGVRFRNGKPVGTEFVAQGHIWGLIIQRKDKQWQVKLYALEPSRVSGIVRGTFNACARKKKITLLTFSQRFIISPSEIHTCEMNDALSQASTSSWRWTERTAWDDYRCMDPKDGSCYLEFKFRLLLAPISHN